MRSSRSSPTIQVRSSFETYVKRRHEINKAHANKRIIVARSADAITKAAPIGAKIKRESLALAIAPLAREDPEKAARLLQEIADTASGVLPVAEVVGLHRVPCPSSRR